MENRNVIELVRYQVTQNDGLNEKREQARSWISEQPGVLCGLTLQDQSDKSAYVDLYFWRSLEEAKAAGKTAMESPRCMPFFSQISEVKLMAHFYTDQVVDTTEISNRDCVWELSVYDLVQRADQDFDQWRPPLKKLVSAQPGFIAWQEAIDCENTLRGLDLLSWSDAEAANKAMEAVHPKEACRTFMSKLAGDPLFGHFIQVDGLVSKELAQAV